MTEQAHPSLSRAQDLFRTIVWDNLTEATLTLIFTEAPVLNIWPIGPLLRAAVRYISDKLFQSLRLFVDLAAIPILNEEHRRKYDAAAVALQAIAIRSGVDSDEYRKAKDNAKAAFAQLVRFNAVG